MIPLLVGQGRGRVFGIFAHLVGGVEGAVAGGATWTMTATNSSIAQNAVTARSELVMERA